MRRHFFRFVAAVAVTLVCLFATACGSKVKGNTYESGFISIAFQSGGKATFASGPISTDCTYSESGSKVTLTCNGQPAVFTVNGDGNLDAPAESMMGTLTKKK